jgi:hypothetical protein
MSLVYSPSGEEVDDVASLAPVSFLSQRVPRNTINGMAVKYIHVYAARAGGGAILSIVSTPLVVIIRSPVSFSAISDSERPRLERFKSNLASFSCHLTSYATRRLYN